MPFSLGHCFIAQILPAPLGLVQMSFPFGLITLLRVSCPPARSWPVALISHLALHFITGFPVSRMGPELVEGTALALPLISAPMKWVGTDKGLPWSRRCSESLVELGWLVTELPFSAPDSEYFACTLISKANRWGSPRCALQARLAS